MGNGVGGGDDDGSVPNPISASTGWDTGGVEGRLRRKRGPPPLSPTGEPLRRVGYALTAPTDEELYLQAGVPGYGESSVPRRATWGATAPEPSPGAAAAAPALAPAAPAAAPAAAAAAAAAAPPLGGARQLRVATGLVPLGSLPSFLSAWRLLALPAYRGADGCLGARLLLGEQRAAEGAAAGAAAGAPAGRGAPRVRGGALQVVVAVTEWRDARALAGAQESDDYVRAMGALGAYFKGAPEAATYASEPENGFLQ
jgi:hypothetical protein